MTYEQTLEYLFSQLPMYQRIGPAAYKANLDNTLALSEYLNRPERDFKSIHIAGTNGKGSVAHMIASVLQDAGYKTGLATSPHLLDFRERIKINGKMIPKKEVIRFVHHHKSFFEKLQPSFFEMAMALTFSYFASQKVDIAVVETGMGGRLDSSNILTPELSVITNIGLDHTRFLGDSIQQIAGEKAGIIKKNIPVVIGRSQKETYEVFKETANQKNAPLYYADKMLSINTIEIDILDGKSYLKTGIGNRGSFLLDLHGNYQAENLLCALAALDVLKLGSQFVFSEKDVRTGLANVVKNTGLKGRWQEIGKKPRVICDAGHNADGIKHAVRQLLEIPHTQLHIVFGMVDDKERSAILELLPQGASYYFCRPSVPRGLDAHKLKREAEGYGLFGNAYNSVKEALAASKRRAKPTDLVFVGGSTFVVAEVV